MNRPDWNGRALLLAPFLLLGVLLLVGGIWHAFTPEPAPETRVERAERRQDEARDKKEDHQKAAVVGAAITGWTAFQAWRWSKKEKEAAEAAAKAGKP